MESQQAQLPPPPGMIASLARGFDSVATHVQVILPPVLLDLFLWLGPRLQLKSFVQSIIVQIPLQHLQCLEQSPSLASWLRH